MNKKRMVVVVTLFLALAAFVNGQTPAPKPAPNTVYVPVAVSGPKNTYVAGLKKENFVVLEDGIEQTISSFAEENQPIDIDLILAMCALQRGRSDVTSIKIREGLENFRQQGNPQNKYVVEEMPFGANGIFDAMSRHITRLSQQSTNPRRMVLTLTDGFESSGGDPVKALQEYAKKLDVPIYIIFAAHPDADPCDRTSIVPRNQSQTTDIVPRNQSQTTDIGQVARGEKIYLSGGAGYEDLTRMTGGRLFQAEADTQLPPFLETLQKELKGQYVLGFKSTNDARDDKWRKLEVKIKAPKGIGDVKEKDMKPKARDRYFVAKVKQG